MGWATQELWSSSHGGQGSFLASQLWSPPSLLFDGYLLCVLFPGLKQLEHEAFDACLANIKVQECWLCAQGQLSYKLILLSIFLLWLPLLEIFSPLSLSSFFCCESQQFLSFFFGGGGDSVIQKGLGCLRAVSHPPHITCGCVIICIFSKLIIFVPNHWCSHFLNYVTLRYLIYAG